MEPDLIQQIKLRARRVTKLERLEAGVKLFEQMGLEVEDVERMAESVDLQLEDLLLIDSVGYTITPERTPSQAGRDPAKHDTELLAVIKSLSERLIADSGVIEQLGSLERVINRVLQTTENLQSSFEEIQDDLVSESRSKDFYTPFEVAELLGKAPFTVREWCRLGRINAQKRPTGRGDADEWEISHHEVERYRNHGLLPVPSKY